MNTYEIITEKSSACLRADPSRGAAIARSRQAVQFGQLALIPGNQSLLLSASKCVTPYWLTFRQANEMRGHVRQGEHSQIVVWKTGATSPMMLNRSGA